MLLVINRTELPLTAESSRIPLLDTVICILVYLSASTRSSILKIELSQTASPTALSSSYFSNTTTSSPNQSFSSQNCACRGSSSLRANTPAAGSRPRRICLYYSAAGPVVAAAHDVPRERRRVPSLMLSSTLLIDAIDILRDAMRLVLLGTFDSER